jgi:hypothetical protein
MLYPLSYERWVSAAGTCPGWLTCRVYMVVGVGQQTDRPGGVGGEWTGGLGVGWAQREGGAGAVWLVKNRLQGGGG